MNANKTLFLALSALLLCSAALAQSVSEPKSVQITAYNDNFALVKETRAVTVGRGTTSIKLEDVASQIDPTSVLFKPLDDSAGIGILEQNYQFDLITPQNILNKSVGQRITITNFDSKGKPYTQSGVLLNQAGGGGQSARRSGGGYGSGGYSSVVIGDGGFDSGGAVVKLDNGKIALAPQGQVSLEKMPEGLKPKPTLNWLVSADKEGTSDAQVSYITGGMSWKADYVALVNKDDTKIDLTGWVTLNNNCGASYKNAKLSLMAGDVRRVREATQQMDYFDPDNSILIRGSDKPQFQEKSFFEYHMYDMQRPVTVADKEIKQLSLLSASGASVVKDMIYDGRGSWFRSWWYPGRSGDPGGGNDTSAYHKVNMVLEAKNSKENNMGMPLPKGRIRVYKLDDTDSQQFIGEDTIDHTPKDEKIRLYVGDAFDVVGDHKRTDYTKVADRVVDQSYEIRVRNHKETSVDVKVVEHAWSDWEVLKESTEHVKKDARTIEFPIKVPANGEVVVTYTTRTKW